MNPGKIGPGGKVAEVHVAAGHEVFEGGFRGVEMVDQRLAGVPIVDQALVEVVLLEDDLLDRP